MKIYTKQELIDALQDIRARGFIPCAREGNHGGIGNTLEDLLGIDENNLPVPNAAEWELKTQRIKTSSLTTLFHMEPSPTAMRLVPNLLLPLYGWSHASAGDKYSVDEKSFRQTINGNTRSDRGFKVVVDEQERKILISFDATAVTARHSAWITQVKTNIGAGELNPQPYWGFDDLFHKAGTKLHNCFYVQAEERKQGGQRFYHYKNIMMLRKFKLDNFLEGIKQGFILVDFDARSGHNHGTKFRLRQNYFPQLYEEVTVL